MNSLGFPRVGIDTISFYTPGYCLKLELLAFARSVDPKIFNNFGQLFMSVIPPDEDIVTMGYNAAIKILSEQDKANIDLLLFATESSIDQARSAANVLHGLLKLSSKCRVLELKQTCYSSTAALQMALQILRNNHAQNKKILVVASDISRYGLGSTGESSQGSGAIAMIISQNPQLVSIERESSFYTSDKMDFWRPNYLDYSIINSKLSCSLYLKLLKYTWSEYSKISGRALSDHQWFCYHVSVPHLIEKAHISLFQDNIKNKIGNFLESQVKDSVLPVIKYSSIVGNCYTASLYLSLISLIINANSKDLANHRVGFYSYGSGCIAEFFSGIISQNYKDIFNKEYINSIEDMFNKRVKINVEQYEYFYRSHSLFFLDKKNLKLDRYSSGSARLAEIREHKRIYEILN
ncbi:hydroxymethylglutaryl-CoA synthase [Rickettsia endosymbiont of Cardiosporidium cionae]|uniref:hydroxymethylglutaryl-CoA synthase n=1 Tax=Rickettsia endosymbiont of Cardiosporidium cionae TaxID=2777155 RepID=UPI001893D6A0|nr:hydroxymethylglutaryl-CoA synthase [Rickettsia endosymbiont of Cardiosporidium cionae]KAF8818734.1 Hydroxymethylglutaryl-CoA synthase [Rickettsia endosymbiont of Cardiosporidium cionae]